MGRQHLIGCLMLGFSLLTGCATQPTPFAAVSSPQVTLPADTPPKASPDSTLEAVLRYGLMADVPVQQQEQLAAIPGIQVEWITETANLADYDIVAGFGVAGEGWEQAPNTWHILTIVNTQRPPLNDPQVVSLLRNALAAFDPLTTITGQDTAEIRVELANQGYPDGFKLMTAHRPMPQINTLSDHLRTYNFSLTLASLPDHDLPVMFDANSPHLLVTYIVTPEQRSTLQQRYPDAAVIDLYALPIRYRLLEPTLPITFTDDGFPRPMR